MPLLFVGACFGTSGGASGRVTIEQLPSKLVQALCADEVRCAEYPDEASCEAAQPESSEIQTTIAGVKSGAIAYDPTAAAVCLDDLSKLSCETFVANPASYIHLECPTVFIGKGDTGAACAFREQCASGVCDTGACLASCCAGTCVACTGSGCTKPTPIADGQPCGPGSVCVAGDVCPTSLGAHQPTCQPPVAEGSTCDPELVNQCEALTTCDASSSTCLARGDVGATCSADADCLDYCACDPSTSTCVARDGVGDGCTTTNCQLNLTCDPSSLTCVAPTGMVCP
jgi:hypothetical protein